MEGIVVPDRVRAAQIISGKAPLLRNRNEQAFAGYRAALDYLFSTGWRPLNLGLILHLHRLLLEQTEAGGGVFKSSDNLVVDRSPDGSVEVRFIPVPANQTTYFVSELANRFNVALSHEGREAHRSGGHRAWRRLAKGPCPVATHLPASDSPIAWTTPYADADRVALRSIHPCGEGHSATSRSAGPSA
jgi:hypothetical protein